MDRAELCATMQSDCSQIVTLASNWKWSEDSFVINKYSSICVPRTGICVSKSYAAMRSTRRKNTLYEKTFAGRFIPHIWDEVS